MAEHDEAPVPDEPKDERDDEPPDNARAREVPRPTIAFTKFSKQQSQLFAHLYSPVFRKFAADTLRLTSTNWFPAINAANRLLPQLKLPIPRIDPALLGAGKGLADFMQKQQASPFAALLERQRTQWDSLFESLRKLVELYFPPNWNGVKHPDLKTIEVMLLDEGIPLAWVPDPKTLQALFDAPNAAKRRQIIGRRWRHIVSACEDALNEVDHPDLRCHQPFAADIVRALRDGHVSAAQALAANLLDSILRSNFEKDVFKIVTTNNKSGTRFDLDDYQARAAFTLAPIWRAYAEYWESQGDPIPRAFGRHPSAHAVSRTQYSRVNAVLALMLVTSLLKLLDRELGR